MSETIRIYFPRLDRYLEPLRNQRHNNLSANREEILRVLKSAGVYDRGESRRTWDRLVDEGFELDVPRSLAIELLESIHGQSVADRRKKIAEWERTATARRDMYPGVAQDGEIEILQESSENLIREDHGDVRQYVAIYVDDVQFRQRQGDEDIEIKAGKYIRIETPSQKGKQRMPGAVVLPVDQTTGDVLLVRQFRHPQRKWLTEAPRGFSAFGDKAAWETARRELWEETGARASIDVGDGEGQLHHLRSLYPDTGKLADRPNYYLALVERDLAAERLQRLGPCMANPVWVPIEAFYRAVYSDGAVPIPQDQMEFVARGFGLSALGFGLLGRSATRRRLQFVPSDVSRRSRRMPSDQVVVFFPTPEARDTPRCASRLRLGNVVPKAKSPTPKARCPQSARIAEGGCN